MPEAKGQAGSSFIFVIIGLLLAVVLIAGAVIGVVTGVKNSRAVLKYEGVRVDEGELNYLLFSYKYEFLSSLNNSLDFGVVNSEAFFAGVDEKSGKTYGELLNAGALDYVRDVTVGAYLFDRYSSLSDKEEEAIEKSVEERINQTSYGDRGAFDSVCEKYGFDSDDMESALRLIYKYNSARGKIYGEDGGVLSLSEYRAECEDYLSTYSHVKLLFVSTEHKYVKNDFGEYVEMDLDPDGQAEAHADIERIRELIRGYETGADEQMSLVAFERYEREYLFIPEFIDGGYYFSPDSEYSAYLESKYPGVVTTALDMKLDSYAELEWEEGICFIYKYPRESGAYGFSVNEDFFGDFYADASVYLYNKTLEVLRGGVSIKDAYYDVDLIALPYDYRLYCRI